MKKWLVGFIMVLFAILSIACSQTEKIQAVKHMDQGYIVDLDMEGKRILVTEYLPKDSKKHPEAAWYRISDSTLIISREQASLRFQDLRAGTLVETWLSGPIAESYPSQATAAKVIVLPQPSTGKVPEAEAIAQALNFIGDKKAWFIQSVTIKEERQAWLVSLSDMQGSSEPKQILVDANSGEASDYKADSGHQAPPVPVPSPAPKVIAENEAFRIDEPEENAEVGNRFTVRGEARVFEAAFSYSFEDGHNILAEGHAYASHGAPEWGAFEITIEFDHATSPGGVLTLYEASAKDGSPQHVLNLPLKIKEEFILRP